MKQAIILAGGRGERLQPLTQDRPKCMVDVMGGPILGYQLRWLKAYGVQRVLLACGYLHESIQAYFGDGHKYGVHIDYLVEDEPLGRGGALKKAILACDRSDDDDLLCLNGDNVCNLSIQDLLVFHRKHKPLATLVVVQLRSPFGIVDIDADDTIYGFREKPELPYGVNAGIYIMNRAVVDRLPDLGDHEVDTFPLLAKEGSLKAFRSRCFWRTVDTVKDVTELRSELQQIFMGSFLQPSQG